MFSREPRFTKERPSQLGPGSYHAMILKDGEKSNCVESGKVGQGFRKDVAVQDPITWSGGLGSSSPGPGTFTLRDRFGNDSTSFPSQKDHETVDAGMTEEELSKLADVSRAKARANRNSTRENRSSQRHCSHAPVATLLPACVGQRSLVFLDRGFTSRPRPKSMKKRKFTRKPVGLSPKKPEQNARNDLDKSVVAREDRSRVVIDSQVLTIPSALSSGRRDKEKKKVSGSERLFLGLSPPKKERKRFVLDDNEDAKGNEEKE